MDVFVNPPAPTIPIPSGYTFYLKFENNFNDEGGLYSPTAYGNLGFVAGKQGQALNSPSDGNDYIDIAPLDFQTFSISFWWKYQTTTSRFFAEDYTASGNSTSSGVYAGRYVDNVLLFETPNGYDFGRVSFDPVAEGMVVGEWYHLTMVSDGTTNINKIYLNAVEKDSATRPASINYSAYTGRSSNFLINTYFYTGASNTNTMDEFVHYPRVLTPQEITDIYNAQK